MAGKIIAPRAEYALLGSSCQRWLLPLRIGPAVYAVESQERGTTRKPTPPNAIGPFYKRLAPPSEQMRLPQDSGLRAFSFYSVLPGHYPGRVCQHIHYWVTAAGHKPLITQLYFATDPVFEGDPDRNHTRDPLVLSRDLVRPVTLTGDPNEIQAHVNFEPVLERL